MAFKDTATGYGWVSILLHWVTAILIVVMLYIGNSIQGLEGEARGETLLLHTSIGVTAYAVLWLRVVWRFVFHHPGPLPAQSRFFFRLGKWVHMSMLVALGVMLVSGPLILWTLGQPVHVFDWFTIPSPLPANFELSAFMHAVHRAAAIVIFVSVLLHIGGVYKHTAFNQDGTLTKIIIPAQAQEPGRKEP